METRKLHDYRLENGWYDEYIKDKDVLDTGYASGEDFTTIVPNVCKSFKGVDFNTPGYNGIDLPFENETFDTCYSSHCLEDVTDYKKFIQEQYRVCKKGGYIIIVVPHYELYEKLDKLERNNLKSKFNGNHKRAYSESSLVMEIEESLHGDSYELRNVDLVDYGYDYSIFKKKDVHPIGNFSIEVVIKKL